MIAARKFGRKVVVCDRPNPISGSAVAGSAPVKPLLLVPGSRARYIGGLAAAPMAAPAAVQQIVWAGNLIIGLPYIYGGGHQSFPARGYDCSGTVSFALHGAALLGTPMVTFYKVSPISWFLGRRLVKAPFLSMVNLVAGRKIVPELMQTEFTAARVAEEAQRILCDEGVRRRG